MVGPQDAEDLTQVTFAKAAQTLPNFRGEAEVSTWLHRLAVNVALDWLRSRPVHDAKLTVPLPERSAEDKTGALTRAAAIEPPPSPEQDAAHKDTHACIRGEIAKLAAPYREALTLSFLGQLDDQQIADTLGITLANAKVRLHRARKDQEDHRGTLRLLSQRTVLRAGIARVLRLDAGCREPTTVTFGRASSSNNLATMIAADMGGCDAAATRDFSHPGR